MAQSPIKLLLVDDEQDAYVLLRSCLSEIQGTKYKLEWVPSIDEGKDALKRGEHDVYLVDYQIGAREGTELLHEAKALGLTSPIVMLTSLGLHETDVECMNLGAADYLNKDFLYPAILERVLRYAMERQRMQDRLAQQTAYRERVQTLEKLGEELRPVSNSILMMSQMLSGTQLTDEQSHYLKTILQAAGILNRLTEQMKKSSWNEMQPEAAKHQAA
jgi:DNA-binding response OmpR family regulator